MPSPTSCSRCSRSSAPAPGRPRSGTPRRRTRRACRSRSATTRRSARSPRSCSSAHAVGRLGRAPVRRLGGDRAAAPGAAARPARSRPTTGRRSTPTSRATAAPAWPCSSRSGTCRPGPTAARPPNVWPLDAQDLGDFAYAAARRYPQVRLFYDWNEPNVRMFAEPNTVEAYEPMARAVYAGVHEADPAAQVVGRQPRALPRRGPRPGRLGRAPARRRRADGLLRRAPVPAAASAARRCATPRTASTCWTCRRSRASPGVPVIVSEFGWSSDDAGTRAPGRLDGAGDRGRALHARARRLRLLGLPRPPGAARRDARSVGPLRLAGRRRSAQARLPGGVRRAARAARLRRRRRARRARPAGWPLLSAIPFPELLSGSDVEPGVLEIEVALDAVHDAVVDAALPPQLDDRAAARRRAARAAAAGSSASAPRSRRRPRRRSAPRSGWRGSGRAPRMRSAVSSRTQSSPASSSRRPSAASAAWMRALVSSLSETPSSSSRSRRITAGQREALEDERREDHAERQVDDVGALREGAAAVDRERQRERGGERDGSAQAGPADQRRGTARADRGRARGCASTGSRGR